jgi:RNA polymerase sigma-70 factor (ECF subfamily)
MSADDPFAELIRRVRAGDADAAAELVRRYEPLIRREVRFRLEDRRLARLFDSGDVCQSVLASFFVRTAAGQFDLDEPGQLSRLLVRMARNKLASAARAQSRQRRDHRRVTGGDEAVGLAADDGPTASRVVAGRELLDKFRGLLTSEERQIADLRAEGLPWVDVADRLGGTPQARRMQLARAAERAAATLGLDADPDGDAE